jgi:hypothetical protein
VGSQYAPHLGDRPEEIAGVMQAADRRDLVEARILERHCER